MRNEALPTYLEGTRRLLISAGYGAVSAELDRALIQLLYPHLSDRNLAEVLSSVTDTSYAERLNQIYELASLQADDDMATQAKQRLDAAGFVNWLAEE